MRPPEDSALSLLAARLDERQKVYEWLVASDATTAMMGAPEFPDNPIPTWEQFCEDYSDSFFLPQGDGFGRVFIIRAQGRQIGCISYDGLETWCGIAELDIWIGSSEDWGHGWGSSAIRELSDQLLGHGTVEFLIIRPSRRNTRAIAAYRKAGFAFHNPQFHCLPLWVDTDGLDYRDSVVLVRAPTERHE